MSRRIAATLDVDDAALTPQAPTAEMSQRRQGAWDWCGAVVEFAAGLIPLAALIALLAACCWITQTSKGLRWSSGQRLVRSVGAVG
jgi:hypothetical protein